MIIIKTVMFSFHFFYCDKVDRRRERVKKSAGTVDYGGTLKKALIHLTISGGHRISQYRSEILPKYQSNLKSIKRKEKHLKESKGIKRGSVADIGSL